jgi:hypothetical protein
MRSDEKAGLAFVVSIFLIIVVIAGIIIGPKGCERHLVSWSAESYGADWLVIQYAANGAIIKSWALKNTSVASEQGSDGIYFKANGNIVHLSGFYAYVQVSDWGTANREFLGK